MASNQPLLPSSRSHTTLPSFESSKHLESVAYGKDSRRSLGASEATPPDAFPRELYHQFSTLSVEDSRLSDFPSIMVAEKPKTSNTAAGEFSDGSLGLSSSWPVPEAFKQPYYEVSTKNCALERRNESLSSDVASLQAHAHAQELEIQRLSAQYTSLSSMTSATISQNATLKKLLAEQRQEHTAEIAQARQTVETLQLRCSQAHQHIKYLGSQLQAVEAERQSLADINGTMWEELKALREQAPDIVLSPEPPAQHPNSPQSPTVDPDVEFLGAQLKKVQGDKADLAQAYAELQRNHSNALIKLKEMTATNKMLKKKTEQSAKRTGGGPRNTNNGSSAKPRILTEKKSI